MNNLVEKPQNFCPSKTQVENFFNLFFCKTTGLIELRAIVAGQGIIDRIFSRSIDDLFRFITKHQAYANLYFGACTRNPGSTSGTKADVCEYAAFWADLDYKDYGQKPGTPVDLQKGEAEARKILAEFPLRPSALIRTGGGLQAYWFFPPRKIEDSACFESILQGICKKLKSDFAVADVARVLRLPCTTNFPSPQKIAAGGRVGPLPSEIEYMEDCEYEFEDFLSFATSEKKNLGKNANTKIPNIPFKDVEQKFKMQLEHDFELNCTWSGNRTDYKDSSRSGHDMGLANSLVKRGYSPEETKAILKKFAHGKGEKDGSEQYFDLTVQKALKNSDFLKSKENVLHSKSKSILEKIQLELTKKPTLIQMSEVEEAEPFFLVEPYVLGDAVTLIAGDGGGGKSQICLAWGAQVSKDRKVCLFSNEDKPQTIKKRLRNQGANSSNVFLCTKSFDLVSQEGQEAMIDFLYQKNPALVVIDSLASYSGNKDLNKSGDVRQIINFLNQVARYFKCAVLVILHLNKGDGKAIYKVSGSTQLVAAARSVLIAGCKPKNNEDSEEQSVGAIFHIKANESKKGKPIGYSLGADGLRWVPNTLTISDILSSDVNAKEDSSALSEAKEFLEDTLKDGHKKISAVKDEAKDLGISPITLRRAKDVLKISTLRVLDDAAKKIGYWRLEPSKALSVLDEQ